MVDMLYLNQKSTNFIIVDQRLTLILLCVYTHIDYAGKVQIIKSSALKLIYFLCLQNVYFYDLKTKSFQLIMIPNMRNKEDAYNLCWNDVTGCTLRHTCLIYSLFNYPSGASK